MSTANVKSQRDGRNHNKPKAQCSSGLYELRAGRQTLYKQQSPLREGFVVCGVVFLGVGGGVGVI